MLLLPVSIPDGRDDFGRTLLNVFAEVGAVFVLPETPEQQHVLALAARQNSFESFVAEWDGDASNPFRKVGALAPLQILSLRDLDLPIWLRLLGDAGVRKHYGIVVALDALPESLDLISLVGQARDLQRHRRF